MDHVYVIEEFCDETFPGYKLDSLLSDDPELTGYWYRKDSNWAVIHRLEIE